MSSIDQSLSSLASAFYARNGIVSLKSTRQVYTHSLDENSIINDMINDNINAENSENAKGESRDRGR